MAGVLSVQFNPIMSNKGTNLERIEKCIRENLDKNLDLIVFPEFFSTGINHKSFQKDPEDENGGNTIKVVQGYAKKYCVNIISGTVITKSNDNFYNTSFAIDRSGQILNKYNKIHLYCYEGGTEDKRITPGNDYVVVDFDFGKIGMAICYDIRYPCQFRKLSQMGAEIITVPSFWLTKSHLLQSEKDIWLSMNKIRAYDNLLYIVSSNTVGRVDDNHESIGNSCIVSPNGEILQNAQSKETAIFEMLDLDIVRQYKKTYPISSIN